MSTPECHRLWEVEALADRRLTERDRESLERHFAGCDVCARARSRHAELNALLRDLPVEEPSEFALRRQRAELLARANDRFVHSGAAAPRSLRVLFGAVLACGAAAAVVVGVGAIRAQSGEARVAAEPPRFEVTEVHDAVFSSQRTEGISTVQLHSGSVSLHVEHVRPGARFIVSVPDGEVEVKGTRFTVDVAEGHTRSVTVTEGVVQVRVGGFVGLVHAGERWPEPGHDAAAAPTAPAPQDVESADASSAAFQHTGASSAASSPSSLAPASSKEPRSASAGDLFVAAMAAFGAGDDVTAERAFDRFVAAHPTDARVEDALYLTCVARSRRGDPDGARVAAQRYLARFPRGLRAADARQFAGVAASGAPSP